MSSPITPPAEPAASLALVERLNEINAMDKTGMSHSERKALRKEVRTIKHTLNPGKGGAIGGGVYISAGVLILVIILLIILL